MFADDGPGPGPGPCIPEVGDWDLRWFPVRRKLKYCSSAGMKSEILGAGGVNVIGAVVLNDDFADDFDFIGVVVAVSMLKY